MGERSLREPKGLAPLWIHNSSAQSPCVNPQTPFRQHQGHDCPANVGKRRCPRRMMPTAQLLCRAGAREVTVVKRGAVWTFDSCDLLSVAKGDLETWWCWPENPLVVLAWSACWVLRTDELLPGNALGGGCGAVSLTEALSVEQTQQRLSRLQPGPRAMGSLLECRLLTSQPSSVDGSGGGRIPAEGGCCYPVVWGKSLRVSELISGCVKWGRELTVSDALGPWVSLHISWVVDLPKSPKQTQTEIFSFYFKESNYSRLRTPVLVYFLNYTVFLQSRLWNSISQPGEGQPQPPGWAPMWASIVCSLTLQNEETGVIAGLRLKVTAWRCITIVHILSYPLCSPLFFQWWGKGADVYQEGWGPQGLRWKCSQELWDRSRQGELPEGISRRQAEFHPLKCWR